MDDVPDGKIVFSTALDNKGLEKELDGLKKKIRSLEDQLETNKKARLPLVEQSSKLGASLDAAKAKLYEMQTASSGVFSAEQIAAQRESVASIQARWNKVQKQVEAYDKKIQKATAELEKNKERAGEVADQLARTGPAAQKMADAMEKAQKSAGRFKLRMREVLRSALLFTLISQGLAQFREWMGKVIKTNDEATAAVARLKGALLTLAQPLVNVLIPAFVTFVTILTDFINVASRLVSLLFGTTIEESAKAAESLNQEAEALDGVGGSAKKAGKALASFDEINKLSAGTGSTGGGNSTISPDFSALKNGILSSMTFSLEDILFDWDDLSAEDIMAKIVTGLAALAGAFIGFVVGGPGGAVLGLLIGSGLGLLLSNLIFDGDGHLNPEELLKSLVLILGTLAGGILGFVVGGPAGAAIGLTLGAGASLLLNKMLFNNDGVLDKKEIMSMIALALGAITGGIIGFSVGGPGGALLGAIIGTGITAKLLDMAFKKGDGLAAQKIIKGLVEFLVGIVGGLIGFAVGGPAGAVIGVTVGVGLSLLIDKLLFSDTSGKAGYDEGQQLGDNVLQGANDSLGINSPSTEFAESGGYVVQGMAKGITDNSQLPVNAFKDILGTLQSEFNSWNVNFMVGVSAFEQEFMAEWNDLWRSANIQFVYGWNNILSNLQTGINHAITALNKLVAAANELADLTGEHYNYVGHISVEKLPIPKLAQGAVIPPNREFLAVLGDQKAGTNIETPLATMIEAFKTAMRDMNMGEGQNEAYLVVDDEVLGKVIYRLYNKEKHRVGVKLSES